MIQFVTLFIPWLDVTYRNAWWSQARILGLQITLNHTHLLTVTQILAVGGEKPYSNQYINLGLLMA